MAKRNGGIIGPDNVPAGPLGSAGGVWRLEDAFNAQKAGTWPVALGYQIPNSLRFNSGSSDNLSRTPSSTTNRRTFTFSTWVKRSLLGSNQVLMGARVSGSDPSTNIRFTTSDTFQFVITGGSASSLVTTQVFRDVSAWYHIVVAVDTTQSTSSDRIKMYVNGVQITSFGTSTYPNLNEDLTFNSTSYPHFISLNNGFSQYLDGYLSELNFIDGQQLTPSSFGQTDSTTGIWTPIAYTGTYGTNGFYLKFANSASLGTDSSGNANTWTVNNLTSVDQSTDTPTNNFATLNPNMKSTNDVVLSEGNLKMVSNFASGWQHSGSTFAVKSGKWYWEAKATVVSATDKTSIGVVQFDTTQVNFVGSTNVDLSTYGISGHGAGTGGYTYAQGDIIMCAMDLGNNKVYWGKNGTFYGTLNPSAGTGSTTQTIDNNNFCMPVVGGYGGSTWELNFGFPQFTIASGNADANGFGNFEYAVPSGYYALCSKNLALYG